MWILMVTLCTGLVGSPAEKCNDFQRDTLRNFKDCQAAAQAVKFTPDTVAVMCLRALREGSDTVKDGIDSEDFSR